MLLRVPTLVEVHGARPAGLKVFDRHPCLWPFLSYGQYPVTGLSGGGKWKAERRRENATILYRFLGGRN